MSNSTRGPGQAENSPFVMHLDRVCRLLEQGQRFTIEFHPYSDIHGETGSRLARNMGLHIQDGGVVTLLPERGAEISPSLSLANYGSVWRCWQGLPSVARRAGTPWKRMGVRG